MAVFVLDARTATKHFPGIGRYVINLASAMGPLLADDERLVLLHDPSRPTRHDLRKLAGGRVQVVDAPISPFSLHQQWAVPRLLHHLRADLYHSSYYLMPYRPDLPTLLTVYDLTPLRYPEHASARARLFFRLTTHLALRTARAIIAISQATRQDFIERFALPPERIITIPLAADPAFRPQPPEAIAAVRARYGLPEAYVLYLGSNKPHKNLVRLVEAWGRLPKPTRRRSLLVVAGTWIARYPEARERTKALGLDRSVRFLGPVPEADLPALYSGATLFVFPSLYEGFGLPVLEAMACGTPVACSNTSSLPEVAGDAAHCFVPTDVVQMAMRIEEILEDHALRDSMRERGLTRVRWFSWTHTAQKTLEVYRVARA
ncbi:MAG TPA: glycosyltransferase family 1 protein [Anaerolineae bacterium]|nr:glycosyltransferase family 1 protein [Anaerolineae bacterium]